MDRWRGKVAVVTGASSGIGLATVKTLVQEGMAVVGLARRKDKMLKEMSGIEGPGKFHAVKCDISKKSDVVEAFEFVKKNLKTLHLLVNNAGITVLKKIEDADMEELEQIMNTNVMGLLHCSTLAIKMMKENGDEGHIVNINSVLGHQVVNFPIPSSIYTASKFAVTAISETLINELQGSKIRVTNLSPGFVLTDILESQTTSESKKINLSKMPALRAEDIANSIAYVVGTPHHVSITELTIRPTGESLNNLTLADVSADGFSRSITDRYNHERIRDAWIWEIVYKLE